MCSLVENISTTETILLIDTVGKIYPSEGFCLQIGKNTPNYLQETPTIQSLVEVTSTCPFDQPIHFKHVFNPFTEENLYYDLTLTRKKNGGKEYYECIFMDRTAEALEKQKIQQQHNQFLLDSKS